MLKLMDLLFEQRQEKVIVINKKTQKKSEMSKDWYEKHKDQYTLQSVKPIESKPPDENKKPTGAKKAEKTEKTY